MPTTTALTTVPIKQGYLVSQNYVGNAVYQNGWQKSIATTVQAGIRIYKDSNLTNNFPIDILYLYIAFNIEKIEKKHNKKTI